MISGHWYLDGHLNSFILDPAVLLVFVSAKVDDTLRGSA